MVTRCCLVLLDPVLKAQAETLADALAAQSGEAVALRAAPLRDAALTVWVARAAQMSLLPRLLAAPGLHWIAAADAELPAFAPLLGRGLADTLSLPLRPGELACRWQRLQAQPAPFPDAPAGIAGSSPALLRALQLLRHYAPSSAGVLIEGETGTGKELFARALHQGSPRADHPFVALNCAALPAELVEAELFGHTRGAFTSAQAARAGLIEAAEGGSLFLDDIDGLPAAAQAKLLRFLELHEYRVLGSNALRHADVRVIAASNRALAQLVAQGVFRADLYHRLNVLALRLPPLRERLEDLPLLAPGLAPAVLARLRAHPWPGNVRELLHVLERARLLAGSHAVGVEHLLLDGEPPDPAPLPAGSLREAKRAFEREQIDRLLRDHGGNVTRAAAAAQKDRRAFIALMRKHAIESAAYRL